MATISLEAAPIIYEPIRETEITQEEEVTVTDQLGIPKEDVPRVSRKTGKPLSALAAAFLAVSFLAKKNRRGKK